MSLTIFTILTVVGSLQICASTVTRCTRIKPTTQLTCICPGNILTYECVTTGSGNTAWTGTRFRDCPSQDNQILLPHVLFAGKSASGGCNDGSVFAQGIEVTNVTNGQCYRSLLNVTVDRLFNNSDIVCAHIATNGTRTEIGNSIIRISGPPEQAVIYLMDANSTHLTLVTRSPVIPNCSHLRYSIEASSNCGSCPESSKSPTIICTNFTTSVDANKICNLTVGGIICDNMPGEKASLLINLKVPNAPFVESQPIYLQDLKRPGNLAELITSFNVTDTFNISNTVDGSAINYTIIYSDSTSGERCSSPIIIPASSCVNGICIHRFDLSSSDCRASANITTTVFASNIFGNGPLSNPITADHINNFVRVSFDLATSRLRCTFLSLPNDVLKQCTANITYGTNCDQQFSDLYSNESTGEFVTIPLELMSDVTEYCFIVTGSSDNLTASVRWIFFAIDTTKMNATSDKGADSEEAGSESMIVKIITPIILILLAVIFIVILSVVLTAIYRLTRARDYTFEIQIKNDITSVIQKLNINVCGFNTYLRHKDFKRQDPDLPGQTLEEDLPRDLISAAERDTISNLTAKFEVEDTNYGTGGNNKIIVRIKFPVKDKVGCLRRALHTLQNNENIKVVGMNTSFIWESDEYDNHHVKFSCSWMQKNKINNELNMKGITVKRVIGQARVDECSTQGIELYVPNSPGNLESALCAFDAYNITEINKQLPDAEKGFQNTLVKCCCSDEDRERLKSKLEEYDAQNVIITHEELDENCNCTVTYSVWHIRGSLHKSIKAFKECNVNIVAINPPTDETQNIEYQKSYIVFESTNEEKTQLIEEIQSINRAFIVKRSTMPLSTHDGRIDAAAGTQTSAV